MPPEGEAADRTAVGTTETSLTIRRTINASRQRVWAALTDPEEMKRWYGADLMDVHIHAFEAESGGTFSITMDDGENRYDIDGTILEVVEHERLAHSWYVGRVRFELDDVGEGCEIVLIHEDLPDRETVEQHEIGWVAAIEALAATLSAREDAGLIRRRGEGLLFDDDIDNQFEKPEDDRSDEEPDDAEERNSPENSDNRYQGAELCASSHHHGAKDIVDGTDDDHAKHE